MTNNEPLDDRPTIDDVHAQIASLRTAYALAKREGRINEMSTLRVQHDSAMRAYRIMVAMRAEGKDPRDYFNS